MTFADHGSAVALETERVESFGKIATIAGSIVGELDFTGLRPTSTSGDTFTSLAACIAPATTTTAGVGIRFDECGRSAVAAAAQLKHVDRHGAGVFSAIF
ncbi:hypothetical protein GOEFS_092_00420 [Gordonia effusa NBRC 100432]|uniref:Uncharacterized protein n=1 Tax=Gordonia effusa NBRC 100432 TaxID=1077974 RepID=H0R3G6_9ACTN|nr:hypothetical protein [Gordonia effusa]GAB19617.1 hypothetical protein GOEFS_092_00420 [Gordonia effusa NBRC 100432]